MAYKFNPFTGNFDQVVSSESEIPDIATTYLKLDGSNSPMTGDLDMGANDLLNVGVLNINSTIDHTITDSSDALVLTNNNSNGNFAISLNRNGTPEDYLKIDTANQRLTLQLNGSVSPSANGVFELLGNITGTIAVGMNFAPTFDGTNFIALLAAPTITNSNSVAKAFWLKPVISGYDKNTLMLDANFQSMAHESGYSDDLSLLQHNSEFRYFFAFGTPDASTVDYKWIKLGNLFSAVDDTVNTIPTITEEMITLTGGVNRVVGNTGSVTQTGIKFTGFGTQTNLIASDAVRAITADGGIFSFKYDYNGTTNASLFGAGEDAGMGYDGTNFVIEPDLVGTGAVDRRGGLIIDTVVKTSDYTLVGNDYRIVVDASSNTVTITLPASPVNGRTYEISCYDSTNTVTIARNGKTILGSASDVTLTAGEGVTFTYDSTNGDWS